MGKCEVVVEDASHRSGKSETDSIVGDVTFISEAEFILKANTELSGELILSPNSKLKTSGFKIFAPEKYYIKYSPTPDGGHKIKCVMGNGADWETHDL